MQYGSHKVIKFKDETVKAYIPPKLPEVFQSIDMNFNKIGKATHALGKLDAICDIFPDTNLFIYLYGNYSALAK